MKFQFQIDNRPAAPVREKWEDAARDAIQAGYAEWRDERAVQFDTTQGGAIARLND